MAETVHLAEAPTTAGFAGYDVLEGARLCFRVRNGSREPLRVTLINAAASGHVQIVDEQSIDAGIAHTFWAHNTIGVPFEMSLAGERGGGIDRLIAIGTTANQDLRYLELDRGFGQATAVTGDKDVCAPVASPPERWTATQVLVRISSTKRSPVEPIPRRGASRRALHSDRG